MTGIGAAVDLYYRGYGVRFTGLLLKFMDDLRDQATLAFIAHADSGIQNDLAAKSCLGH